MVEDRDSKWEMKHWPWRMMRTWGVWAGWKAGTAASEEVVWDFQRNMEKFVGWEGGLGGEWIKGCTGSNCFLSRKGDTKLQESGLKSEKNIELKGGWWSDFEKVVQNDCMLVCGWEGSIRVLWQGKNIFVLLLHPTVRRTAKWAFPRNAKEPPEFWAELWRCWFCWL